MKKHILFVCRANVNRSKLAEELYKNDPRYDVRSAGIYDIPENFRGKYPDSKKATEEDVKWADNIFTFFVREEFLKKYSLIDETKVTDLEIYDSYNIKISGHRERLKEILIEKLYPYLGEPQ